MTSTPPTAMWTIDPQGEAALRFHDGTNWTHRVLGRRDRGSSELGWIPAPLSQDWDRRGADYWGSLSSRPEPSTGRQALGKTIAATLLPAFAMVGALFVFVFIVGEEGPDGQVDLSELRWSLSVAGAVVVIGALWSLSYRWRRWTLLADIPTVSADGLHLGMCEVDGTVEALDVPVLGFATERPSVWTLTALDERVRQGKRESWKRRWEVSNGSPAFWLRDASGGRTLVDLTGHGSNEWQILQARRSSKDERVSEWGITVGQPMSVLGFVQTDSDGRLVLASHDVASNGTHRRGTFMAQPGDASIMQRREAATTVVAVVQVAVIVFVACLGTLGLAAAAVVAAASVIGVGIVGWTWRTWNRMVEVKWRIAAAEALIGALSERRATLIPQLAEVSRAAAGHEHSVHLDVAQARREVVPDDTNVVMRGEAYPALNASGAFMALGEELTRCENQLAAARGYYNDAVTVAKTHRGTFPTGLIARLAIPTTRIHRQVTATVSTDIR